MEVKGIVTIGLEHIHPHPDNPRKDLGDLTELAESIKKNGIMQNLTVIPKEGEPGEYSQSSVTDEALQLSWQESQKLPAGLSRE